MIKLWWLILLAIESPATTYGYGEPFCGDIGNPKPCLKGAITASGEVFDPEIPTAAVPAPTGFKLSKPINIWVRLPDQTCVKVRINDKSNPRWIADRGLDLSPKAVELLTGERTKHFKQKIELCIDNFLP